MAHPLRSDRPRRNAAGKADPDSLVQELRSRSDSPGAGEPVGSPTSVAKRSPAALAAARVGSSLGRSTGGDFASVSFLAEWYPARNLDVLDHAPHGLGRGSFGCLQRRRWSRAPVPVPGRTSRQLHALDSVRAPAGGKPSRWFHREALRGILPAAIADRASKPGFSRAVVEWGRRSQSAIQQVLDSPDWLSSRFVDRTEVRALLSRLASRAPDPVKDWDDWRDIRSIVNIEVWHRAVLEYLIPKEALPMSEVRTEEEKTPGDGRARERG